MVFNIQGYSVSVMFNSTLCFRTSGLVLQYGSLRDWQSSDKVSRLVCCWRDTMRLFLQWLLLVDWSSHTDKDNLRCFLSIQGLISQQRNGTPQCDTVPLIRRRETIWFPYPVSSWLESQIQNTGGTQQFRLPDDPLCTSSTLIFCSRLQLLCSLLCLLVQM